MITVESLIKSYNANHVLHDIDHDQRPNKTIILIDPNNYGKSTFLRCLNMLEVTNSNHITINNITIKNKRLPQSNHQQKQQRQLRIHTSIMFQSFNLFPHLTVLQNIIAAPTVVKSLP